MTRVWYKVNVDELIFYLDAANKFPIISKNNQEW